METQKQNGRTEVRVDEGRLLELDDLHRDDEPERAARVSST